MHDRIRRHLTYANLVSTICLFVVLGGGAYAASSFIGSGGVLHGCVSRKGVLTVTKGTRKCPKRQIAVSWNQRGPIGTAGPKGQTGAKGGQGVQGERGLQGERGPSHAYSAQAEFVSIPVSPGTTIATLSLPAGSYSIGAKLYIRAQNIGSYTWLTNCTLTAGAKSDFSQAEGQPTGGNDGNAPMSLALLQTFAGPGSAVLSCEGNGASMTADNVVLTAIRVGAIN